MMVDRTCTIDGCDRKYRARGWCATHYAHWQQHGDPLAGIWHPTARLGAEERFWLKVDKSGECWLWTAGINRNGYGTFTSGEHGASRLAHRFAYKLLIDPPPAELDHACLNRLCVRPDPNHVRPVTRKQNLENRSGAQSNSTSGIRGVSWDSRRRKWEAYVTHNTKKHHFGYFSDITDAEAAAITGRNRLFTHNQRDREANV